MLGILQMNFKVLQFTIWEKLPSSTRINSNIFCHLKIITQSDDLFGGKEVYFLADANLKIRSSEKVYEGLKGTKTTKDFAEFNYVGKRQQTGVTARTEQVWTGVNWSVLAFHQRERPGRRNPAGMWHDIYANLLGMVKAPNALRARTERGVLTIQKPFLPPFTLLIFCPLQ